MSCIKKKVFTYLAELLYAHSQTKMFLHKLQTDKRKKKEKRLHGINKTEQWNSISHCTPNSQQKVNYIQDFK